jgi:hypothetical protein
MLPESDIKQESGDCRPGRWAVFLIFSAQHLAFICFYPINAKKYASQSSD